MCCIIIYLQACWLIRAMCAQIHPVDAHKFVYRAATLIAPQIAAITTTVVVPILFSIRLCRQCDRAECPQSVLFHRFHLRRCKLLAAKSNDEAALLIIILPDSQIDVTSALRHRDCRLRQNTWRALRPLWRARSIPERAQFR